MTDIEPTQAFRRTATDEEWVNRRKLFYKFALLSIAEGAVDQSDTKRKVDGTDYKKKPDNNKTISKHVNAVTRRGKSTSPHLSSSTEPINKHTTASKPPVTKVLVQRDKENTKKVLMKYVYQQTVKRDHIILDH